MPTTPRPRHLTIGELSRRVGLPTSALRYYESAGLVEPPPRVGGQRRYPLSAVRDLVLIRMARNAGLTIARTRELLRCLPRDASPARRWETIAAIQLSRLDEQIERLQGLRDVVADCVECGCMNPARCELLAYRVGDESHRDALEQQRRVVPHGPVHYLTPLTESRSWPKT